jgi:uncharacterized membrane protein YvbJ
MNIVEILIALGVFAIILVVIAIVIIKAPKPEKQVEKVEAKKDNSDDFERLLQIVKNRDSSSQEIKKALIDFNDNHIITEENLKDSMVFLTYLLNHKNRSKELFDIVHKELKVTNRKFAEDITKIELKCLNN